MCFVNDDYDWLAEVVEQSDHVLLAPIKCDECCRVIEIGETVHHIFMQQYEECHRCYEGECECEEEKCCQCSLPKFGEMSDYDRCQECDKFLQAVENAELEAGCDRRDSRPPLTEMRSAIGDGGIAEAKRYFKMAKRDFPELAKSGYLGRLWKRMFV